MLERENINSSERVLIVPVVKCKPWSQLHFLHNVGEKKINQMNYYYRPERKQKYNTESLQICQVQLIQSSSAGNTLGMAPAYKHMWVNSVKLLN